MSRSIPLVIWVAAWAQLLPVVAAAWRRWRVGPLERAGRGIVVWLLLLFTMDMTAWSWTHLWGLGNNLSVSYAFMPLHGTAILWALAEWQVLPLARSTVRICIPLLWVWWALNIAFFENTANFSVLGNPVLGIIALVAALLAFVGRVQREDEPMLGSAWGWILPGVAIFFATNTAVTILQNTFTVREEWVLLERVIKLKSSIDILAMCCIAGGFLWPNRPSSSGVSSSPAPFR